MKQKIAEYAKFIAAVLGLAATSFAFAVPPEVAPWVASTVGFLTAIAVLLVPNATKPVDADAVLVAHSRLDPDEQYTDIQAAISRTH